jgi:hypothetical protein
MRKKKHRKVYSLVNPIFHAIEGAAITDEDTLNKLRDNELKAIEAFRLGAANEMDWKVISEFCNLAESMARDGIGPEALVATSAAQEALKEAHDRYLRIGKMGTTGQGLTAFKDAYEYHDLQRQSVARSVYERHIERVYNKIKSKSPDVIFLTKKEEK